ncbi:MAG: GyrI-like domain-containing protein [Alkalispirochaetaceae bacterium]
MELREAPERATLSIRTTTPADNLPQVMGKSFWQIMDYLSSEGVQPAGPPYALYHNMDMSNLDVEMGFPVNERVPGNEIVRPSSIPAGTVAVDMHLGPYDTMEVTYNRMLAALQERGLEMDTFMYEFYLNDPDEVSPEEIQTEIFMPVKQT